MVGKKEILSKFLKGGYQLDQEALEFFVKNPEKTDAFLEIIKKNDERPATITMDVVFAVLGRPKETADAGVEIIKEFFTARKKEKVGIEQYMSIYKERYDKISGMLIEKMSGLKTTSINKIQKQPDFSLIVMVREKDPVEKSLVVEDPTGNTTVAVEDSGANIADYEMIVEDDILGIVCEHMRSGITAKQIIWPDVPLNRKTAKAERSLKCIFLPDAARSSVGRADLEDAVSFVLGEDTVKITLPTGSASNSEIVLKRPALISVSGVKIFLITSEYLEHYKSLWPSADATKIATNLLKRRCFVKDLDMAVFDEIPDLFITSGFDPATSNYKGISIISVGGTEPQTAWILELNTREINKLELS